MLSAATKRKFTAMLKFNKELIEKPKSHNEKQTSQFATRVHLKLQYLTSSPDQCIGSLFYSFSKQGLKITKLSRFKKFNKIRKSVVSTKCNSTIL